MMKVTVAALLALQGVAAFAPAAVQQRPALVSLHGVSGAAASAEEDLMLTLKVIMDHAERSTTVSKDQYISQMEESKLVDEVADAVDISIPYDAAAKLAYEAAGSPGDYEAFKTKFEEDAVADVIAKNAPPVDVSVPYDAAAKLAYEAAGSPGDYAAFKTKYEEDAVAYVIAKNEPPVDVSVPYDAAAKLAYEAAGSPGDYGAFKTKYEEDAVAYVIAKNAPPAEESSDESVDISIPYDAAAKLAYEKAGSPGDYAEFKAKFEADAVADVIAKTAKPEPVEA